MAPHECLIVDSTGKKLNSVEIENCIGNLRCLVLADNKLKNMRTDYEFLFRFLHCMDFDTNSSFLRMQEFYDFFVEYRDWFLTSSPLENKELIEQNIKVILPNRDLNGRRVYIVKSENINTSKIHPADLAKLDDIWFEAILDEPETVLNGLSIVVDLKGFSWKMFKWLTPTNIKGGSKKTDFIPFKNVLIHVVNTSVLLTTSIKMVWPFLSSKTKDQIKFHFDDWSSLHEYISPEILPPEYGGVGPKLNYESLNQLVYSKNDAIGEKLKCYKI